MWFKKGTNYFCLLAGTRVTLEDFCGVTELREELIRWLEKRRQMELSNLLVNLTTSNDWYDFQNISKLCVALHPHCMLEVGGCPFRLVYSRHHIGKYCVCHCMSNLTLIVSHAQVSRACSDKIWSKTKSSSQCEFCSSDYLLWSL